MRQASPPNRFEYRSEVADSVTRRGRPRRRHFSDSGTSGPGGARPTHSNEHCRLPNTNGETQAKTASRRTAVDFIDALGQLVASHRFDRLGLQQPLSTELTLAGEHQAKPHVVGSGRDQPSTGREELRRLLEGKGPRSAGLARPSAGPGRRRTRRSESGRQRRRQFASAIASWFGCLRQRVRSLVAPRPVRTEPGARLLVEAEREYLRFSQLESQLDLFALEFLERESVLPLQLGV